MDISKLLQAPSQTKKIRAKWSEEEDRKLVELRGRRETWENISKEFTGRSALSCRLHYQNYLERPEWDDKKASKVANLYQR